MTVRKKLLDEVNLSSSKTKNEKIIYPHFTM